MPIIGNLSSGGKKPTTPTIGTATDGGTGTTASVAFTASSYIGKGTITYTALSSPGSLTGTGAGSPITVSGLTTGTAYTFTVKGDTNYGVASDYSAASNSVTPASPSSYESIATVNGTGSSGVITFSSIPSGYKGLQIRAITRGTYAAAGAMATLFRVNGDTATNYTRHALMGLNTVISNDGNNAETSYQIRYSSAMGNTTPTQAMGVIILDILDYTSTSKYKTFRNINGYRNSTSGDSPIRIGSGMWQSTAAINSITLTAEIGNWSTATSFALYGVK